MAHFQPLPLEHLPDQFWVLFKHLWFCRRCATPSLDAVRCPTPCFPCTWAHLPRVELAVLSGEERGAPKMKACVVTEAFITLGSNGMQGTRGRVTDGYLDRLGRTRVVIVLYVVSRLPFSVSQLTPGMRLGLDGNNWKGLSRAPPVLWELAWRHPKSNSSLWNIRSNLYLFYHTAENTQLDSGFYYWRPAILFYFFYSK